MTFVGADASRDSSVLNTTTLTNSTAIGNGARIFANNQVSLGNASVTSTILRGNVGIGTTNPTNILSLANTAAQKFWIENTATDVVGRALTVSAGGTVAGTSVSDVTGGNLILQSGLGTGTGASTISFQTGTTLTTSTTLQTMSTKMTILGNGNVGIGTTGPTSLLQVTAGSDANTSVTLGGGGTTPSTYRSNLLIMNTPSSGSFPGQNTIRLLRASTALWDIGIDSDGSTGAKSANTDFAFYSYSNSSYNVSFPQAGGARFMNGSVGIGTATPRAGSTLEVAGIIQTDAQTTDPGCTAIADIGKLWFDNTTTTTVEKHCMNVAGTLTWKTVTFAP